MWRIPFGQPPREPMPPDALALYATVILLLPMACFFLSSPTFLLVGLEVPEVTQLLRGLFLSLIHI